jgi:SAM-dependent methyltransferase
MRMTNHDPLPWTGERFLPTLDGNIAFEHLHRYALACLLARDKTVLDIASGEGYGSRLLSSVAKHVTGVDIDEQSVTHATRRYPAANLVFRQGSCLEIPADDGAFELVVCFETIEHVDDHHAVYREFRRVLSPTGTLFVSCPDKSVYSDAPGYVNPFHVHELYLPEFVELNRAFFTHSTVMQQKIVHGSAICPIDDADAQHCGFVGVRGNAQQMHVGSTLHSGVYNLAICSNTGKTAAIASVFEGLGLHTDLELAFRQLQAGG